MCSTPIISLISQFLTLALIIIIIKHQHPQIRFYFMATRSVVLRSGVGRLMEGARRSSSISGLRYFSDDKGRVLSEEERAKENVYIQKWEREKLEKQKLKAEKQKAEREKSEKKAEEGAHKS